MLRELIRRLLSLLIAPATACAVALGVLVGLCLAGCLPSPVAVRDEVKGMVTTAQKAQAARKAQKCPPIGAMGQSASCEAMGDCLHLLSDAGQAGAALVNYLADGQSVPSTAAVTSVGGAAASIDRTLASALPAAASLVSTIETDVTQGLSEKAVSDAYTTRRDSAKNQCIAVAGVK